MAGRPDDELLEPLGTDATTSDEAVVARLIDEVHRREQEQLRLEEELADTNRGVVALYAELEDRAERLRASDEAKTKFLSSVSHELRTPLNSVLALARLLEDEADGPLTEEQRRQVGFIRTSVEDLLVLVNNLLDLARIEAGRIDLSLQEFALSNVFAALGGAMAPLRRRDEVELVIEPAATLPNLVQDERKLSQILRNFVSNALKYTERGFVRVSAVQPGPETIRISVADSGIGIPAREQARVFDEFSQVPGPLQGIVKGTGLGLAVSKALAGVLGGQVGVESAPGSGSTFWVELPVRHPSLDPVDADTAEAATARTILVVDDDAAARYVLGQVLRAEGHGVIEATGGLPALARARDEQPALVVLDLSMPDLDGFAVLARLKQDRATSGIPVIVYSSRELTAEEHDRLSRGAAAIVSKADGTSEQLIGAVRDILSPGTAQSGAQARSGSAR